MPAIRGGMVAGDGQGQNRPPVPLLKAPRLHRREIVGLAVIAMHRKVAEVHPGQAADGIGVFRRQRSLPGQESMVFPITGLILGPGPVKLGKILAELRPLHGEGFIVPVKHRIQRGQRIIHTQRAVLFRQAEGLLGIEGMGHQPQIGRVEFQPTGLQRGAQAGDIHLRGKRIARGSHMGKVVKMLPPGIGAHIDGGKAGHVHRHPFLLRIYVLPLLCNRRCVGLARRM